MKSSRQSVLDIQNTPGDGYSGYVRKNSDALLSWIVVFYGYAIVLQGKIMINPYCLSATISKNIIQAARSTFN